MNPKNTAAQNFAVFVAAPYNVIRDSEGSPNPQIRHYSARLSTNFKLSGMTDPRFWRQFEVGGAIRWQDTGFLGYSGVQLILPVFFENS